MLAKRNADAAGAIDTMRIRRLQAVKEKHPYLSYADIWTLAGYVAIEESGGPAVTFSMGRKDFSKAEAVASETARRCDAPSLSAHPNLNHHHPPPPLTITAHHRPCPPRNDALVQLGC